MSNLYGTEINICAGFWSVANTGLLSPVLAYWVFRLGYEICNYSLLQAIYSLTTVKNSFTVHNAFNPCNRGDLLLRIQEKV